MKKLFCTLTLTALLATQSLFAQEQQEEQQQGFGKEFASTIKEVFVKGSIDGKDLFLVYGMGDGVELSKEIMDNAIDIDTLEEMGDDFVEGQQNAGSRIWNKEHDDDYVGYVKEGYELAEESLAGAGESAKRAFTRPWKSLQKIPQSYKLTFEQASDAYYNSDNQIAGAVKYAGLAVWANIKGSYYLVIEAPARMAGNILAATFQTAWSIAVMPLAVTWNTLALVVGEAYTVSKIAIRSAIQVIRFTGCAIGTAAVASYSFLTSSVATIVTAVAGGGLAVFEAGKWLINDMPSLLFSVARIKEMTEIDFTNQHEYAERIQAALESMTLVGLSTQIKAKVKKYQSRFVVSLKNGKEKFKAFVVKTIIKDKKVMLKISATKKLLRFLKDENSSSRSAAKEEIKSLLSNIALELENA